MIEKSNAILKEEIKRLAKQIHIHAPYDGFFNLEISNLGVGRHSKTGDSCVKTFASPSLLIVAQGVKEFILGSESFQIGKAQMLMLPVALPVEIYSLEASQSEPFLNIGLNLDPLKIYELTSKVYPKDIPPVKNENSRLVANADINIINAANRLMNCLSNAMDSQYIAPLIIDEILIRALRSTIGNRIVQMGFKDSYMQEILKSISWLTENFQQQIKVSSLAKMSNMSESTFHERFKAVTSMTPIQYQKSLRLYEARRLMISKSLDATTACGLVGYVSDSQFNRDYSRMFGNSPKRDVTKLRHEPPLNSRIVQ